MISNDNDSENNAVDVIDFDNAQQNLIVLELFEILHCESQNLHQTLLTIKNDFPSSLITKTLNEYRLYHDHVTKKDWILSKYESSNSKLYKFTLIHYFVINKRYEIVKFLLENFKPNLELKMNFVSHKSKLIRSVTCLWLATYLKCSKIMLLLLENGADPNVVNDTGASPLRITVPDDTTERSQMLLKFNADPNLTNKFKNTVLMFATYKNKLETVKLLLNYGADVNQSACCGNTALHIASSLGNIEIVKELLKHGAIFQSNISGLTPLFEAALNLHENLMNFYFEIPNLVTLQDRIIAYELSAAGVCFKKVSSSQSSFYAKIVANLRKSFILRYSTKNLNSCEPIELESIQFDPKALPNHPKPFMIHKEYRGSRKEIETYQEFEIYSEDDEKRLLYECLFILERFHGEQSLQTAEALITIGAHLLDQYDEFIDAINMWNRAVRIKINRKIFISEDLFRIKKALILIQKGILDNYFEHEFDLDQSWIDLINLIIQYFEARPVPNGLEAFGFQLDAHDLNHIEHFTLNESKIENMFTFKDNEEYLLNEKKDIDRVIEVLIHVFLYFAKKYTKLSEEKKRLVKKTFGKFLKLNYNYSGHGQNLIHLIFIHPETSRKISYIASCLSLLYNCGINTNVYDNAYNTPLHYLAFYCYQKSESLRVLANLSKTLIEYVYYGKFFSKALHHSDYAGISQIHLDAVNIFNQTAFDTNPALTLCVKKLNLNYFPLKCLAARVAHSYLLRCNNCRYLSNYRSDIDRLHYNFIIRGANINNFNPQFFNDNVDDNIHRLYDESINLNNPNFSIFKHRIHYSTRKYYIDHPPKRYDAKKIWKLINEYSERFCITAKLLEFIEMHGPCKFAHLVEEQEKKLSY